MKAVYTKEEIEKIRDNYRQICAYSLENFVSKLMKDEMAKAVIDGCTFICTGDGDVAFNTGGRLVYFTPGHEYIDYTGRDHYSPYDYWSTAITLITNWADFKRLMKGKVEEVEAERKAIMEFQV